jgi:hypothetical protein
LAIADVADLMDSAEAVRVCAGAGASIVKALDRQKDADDRGALLQHALKRVVRGMEPTEAAPLLLDILGRETDAHDRWFITQPLAEVADRSDATQAARLCSRAAGILLEAFNRPGGAADRQALASALAEVMGRIDRTEAGRLSGQVARTLAEAFDREKDAEARTALAWGLASVGGHADPIGTARTLADAVEREQGSETRRILASALSKLATRLDFAEAERVSERCLHSLIHQGDDEALTGAWGNDRRLTAEFLRNLGPTKARVLAREFVFQEGSIRAIDVNGLPAVLDEAGRVQIGRRAGILTMMVGLGLPGPFAWARGLASEPFPCRLTTRELVELLKMPTCFGSARRVVLDHLGNRYGRRFVNHWAFVRFAREQGLDLDFTTPLRRPDPQESVKRMLEILDRPS